MFPIVQMSRPKHDEVSGLSGLVSCACRTLDGGDRKPVRVTPVVIREGGKEGESPAASPHLPASWSPGLLGGELLGASGAYQACAKGRRPGLCSWASGCPPTWEVLELTRAMEEGAVGSDASIGKKNHKSRSTSASMKTSGVQDKYF